MSRTLRLFQLFILILSLAAAPLFAGELYYTGFDAFTVGNDTLVGTESWAGSSPHAGFHLSGVDAEADHLVAGIGNAAFIGGNSVILPSSVTNRTVNVRKPFGVDPMAKDPVLYPDGREVVQFHVNFGIKDSSFTGVATRRDNFEFAFYNSSNYLLGFIQFDNTTLDTQTQAPAQKIWRSSWSGTAFTKQDTGTTYIYDELMELKVRINFRTNRWTASLDGLDIFSDLPFYTGSQAKTLGSVAAQMQIGNNVLGNLAPGDNYMLFDDFAVRLDPLTDPFFYSFTRNSPGSVQFTWLNEAMYKYQVQYTDDLTQPWKNDLPNSLTTPTVTGVSPVFTDATAASKSRRYYRVQRTVP